MLNNGQKIWILGGGKYGLIAARRLSKRDKDTDILVIDDDTEVCQQVKQLGYSCICNDGINFLAEDLNRQDPPRWVIPVIPLHVAYLWIKRKLRTTHRFTPVVLPEDLLASLPNAARGEGGAVFVSNADFICPSNCAEPDTICSQTGKPRPRILHQFLSSLKHGDFQFIVLQSHQLLPGVGGYHPAALFEALDTVARARSPVVLATACSCHGVLTGFEAALIKSVGQEGYS